MATPKPPHCHLIVGGFPAGEHGGHDMDYARMRILETLNGKSTVSVSPDYTALDQFLRRSSLLVTYTSGPVPDESQAGALKQWIEGGGRWVCLHGSSGGKAAKLRPGEEKRRIEKMDFHEVLGCMFLHHPPSKRFDVTVEQGSGASPGLLEGLPAAGFSVQDEPYVIKLLGDVASSTKIFLSYHMNDAQSRYGGGFQYDEHPALDGPTGTKLALGYERTLGKGGVVYIALGHATPPYATPGYVVESANPGGKPMGPAGHVEAAVPFAGPWPVPEYQQLLKNAMKWGLEAGLGGSKL